MSASGDFTMPLKHTTGVQFLLRWPSIRGLLPSYEENELTETYVMDLEMKRGLLHWYGQGAGKRGRPPIQQRERTDDWSCQWGGPIMTSLERFLWTGS